MRLCWWLLPLAVLGCGRPANNRIIATGTVEETEVDVAPTVPARVLRVLVDEGAMVRTGDTIAVLTQTTMSAEIEQQDARRRAAEAQLREAVAGPRGQEVERARAEVALTEAEVVRTSKDLERIQSLSERDLVSRQALDAARAAANAANARRNMAREALALLQEGTRHERVQAARAEVTAARAALSATESMARDLVLLAPIDGLVMSRNAEPGEMLMTGQSAVTLGQVAKPYIRVYVRTGELPRLKVGQPATAVLDGLPDHPFAGTIVAISHRAEYTPRVALTERERADLVFGVKIALVDTTGMLKPGLPATVHISTPAP